MALEVVQATAEQAKALREASTQLEGYVRTVAPVVLRRLAWWKAFKDVAGQYDLDVEDVAGADVVALNEQADRGAEGFILWTLALDMGAAELVGIDEGRGMHIGVAPKGSVPRPMEAFPFLALVVVGGIATIGWLVFDAWTDARTQEALARRAEAANQARKLELIGKAQAMGPAAVSQISAVLKQVDDAAARRSTDILTRAKQAVADFASGVADVATTTAGGIGAGAIVVILLLLWGARRRT